MAGGFVVNLLNFGNKVEIRPVHDKPRQTPLTFLNRSTQRMVSNGPTRSRRSRCRPMKKKNASPLNHEKLSAMLRTGRERLERHRRQFADRMARKPQPAKKQQPAEKPKTDAPPPKPEKKRGIVVLVPALLHPVWMMKILAWKLRRAGYDPRMFRYPSYRNDLPDNARRLATFLRELGAEEIDIVGHSLGGMLVRWAANHHELPRLRRVVMLGTPNQGAFMADWLAERLGLLFPLIWGRSAHQLRRGDVGLCARAGLLPKGTELGVVAGGTGKGKGFNPLIPTDNDFTVGVSETVLSGMTDFALVRMTHTMLPCSPKSMHFIVRFLETGHFRDRNAH